MENQRNQFGEHPWQPLDFRRLSEYQASPRSVGAAEQADPGDARLISQSAFLIGSLELDDLDSDRDVARQQAMLTATSGSSQQSLRDTFMTGVSGSSDPPSSSGSMRPLVGQFQTSARGSVCLSLAFSPPRSTGIRFELVIFSSKGPRMPVFLARIGLCCAWHLPL